MPCKKLGSWLCARRAKFPGAGWRVSCAVWRVRCGVGSEGVCAGNRRRRRARHCPLLPTAWHDLKRRSAWCKRSWSCRSPIVPCCSCATSTTSPRKQSVNAQACPWPRCIRKCVADCSVCGRSCSMTNRPALRSSSLHSFRCWVHRFPCPPSKRAAPLACWQRAVPLAVGPSSLS